MSRLEKYSSIIKLLLILFWLMSIFIVLNKSKFSISMNTSLLLYYICCSFLNNQQSLLRFQSMNKQIVIIVFCIPNTQDLSECLNSHLLAVFSFVGFYYVLLVSTSLFFYLCNFCDNLSIVFSCWFVWWLVFVSNRRSPER